MKIGMFLAPSEQVLYTGISQVPHTLGVMTAYLRGKGNMVHQYDLNTDLLDYYSDHTLTKDDIKIIFDKDAVINYINGEENPVITRFIEKMLANKPIDSFEITGVSIGGTFYWLSIHAGFLIARYIKKKYRIPVVIGGNNMVYLNSFKSVYYQLWQAVLKAFRFVIVGSGLESFRKIIERVKDNPNWTPASHERSQLKGLLYMENGNVLNVVQDRCLVVKPDFKGLPLDDYMYYLKDPGKSPDPQEAQRQNLDQIFKWPHTLGQLANQVYRKREKRKEGVFIKKLVIPYVFSYHCPYKCAFCAESNKENQVVLGDPIETVNDIQELLNEYNTEYISFFNNYFNLSKKFALTFCQEVKKRKLKFYWSDCARFTGIDLDFLQELKESGCQTLWFGMETASKKLLEMINKELSLKQMEEGLDLCQKVGIRANLEVIIGFPNETHDDFRKTAVFLKRNAYKINYFQPNRFYIIPDSTIGRFPEKFDIELVKDVITYDSLSKANLEWFLSGKDLGAKPNNFHIYTFNEIGARKHDEIFKDSYKRQRYLYKLQSREFLEIRQMLILLDSISKPKTG